MSDTTDVTANASVAVRPGEGKDPPVTAQAGVEVGGGGINHLHMVVVSIFEKRMFIFASISKPLSN